MVYLQNIKLFVKKIKEHVSFYFFKIPFYRYDKLYVNDLRYILYIRQYFDRNESFVSMSVIVLKFWYFKNMRSFIFNEFDPWRGEGVTNGRLTLFLCSPRYCIEPINSSLVTDVKS